MKKQVQKNSASDLIDDPPTQEAREIAGSPETPFTAKMQYEHLENAVKEWNPDHYPEVREERIFLTLAGDHHPPILGANLQGKVGEACAGIILLGKVEAAELASVLDDAPDPSLPIADFGNNETLRRDFIGSSLDETSLKEMEQQFAPVWRRLAELPFTAAREFRAEMNILRLAYSRDTPIAAALDPNVHQLVKYPLLGPANGERQTLEMLAQVELLRRRHFTRTHVCAKCESARLNVYEACPSCGSANLHEEPLVHHYRCGCQDIESKFRQDQLLVCPKCERTLTHFGVDYGKPGTALVCGSCKATNSEPFINFMCLDCSTVTPASEAKELDWYHYDLTEDGVLALQQGQLPQFDLAPLLERRAHAYSPREFRLLATHELNVSKRFGLPFSVARITVLNIDELVRKHGAVAAVAGFQRVVDAVVDELRTTDFVGASTMQSTVIGFPGTSAKDVDIVIARISQTIDATIAARVEIGVEVAEGDAVIELLSGS